MSVKLLPASFTECLDLARSEKITNEILSINNRTVGSLFEFVPADEREKVLTTAKELYGSETNGILDFEIMMVK